MNLPTFLLLFVTPFFMASRMEGPMFRDGEGVRVSRNALPQRDDGLGAVPDSILQTVRAEYGAGRFWHGVRLLRDAYSTEDLQADSLRLLLAAGEAGWGDWGAVGGLLEEPLNTGLLSGREPWTLLGRSLEGMEAWNEAAEAYGRALEAGEAEVEEGSAGPPEGAFDLPDVPQGDPALLARRARVLAHALRFREAREACSKLRTLDPDMADWVDLAVAVAAAEQGERDATVALLSAVERDDVRRVGWDLPARALLAAGDSTGAEAAFWSALPGLQTRAHRAEAWTEVARLRLARADSLGARGAYHQVLGEGVGGGLGVEAASALMTLGVDSIRVARRSAELLAGAGRREAALGAWDRYLELLDGSPGPDVLLALAGLHLRMGAPGRALETVTPLLADSSAAVGGPALVLQAQSLRDLGRMGEARRIQDTLVARFPSRPEAVEILFLRADALEDRGDLTGALAGFQAAAELSPTQNLAGQARMRMGQIYLTRGRLDDAANVFLAYLGDFPSGRRWDEAAFWAGRALMEAGKEEEAREVLGRLTSRFPLSYYTVQADLLTGEPYAPDLAPPSDSLPLDPDLVRGLALVDRLIHGGSLQGAQWEVDGLVSLVRDGPVPGGTEDAAAGSRLRRMVSLAGALNQRGFTREGINLGWAIIGGGGEWTGDVLAAVYPFPYRDLVLRGAREDGLDPFLMAGLIRQESAFWARAVSRADARGLMQVLPATGAELARARGPQPFNADEHLFRPEVNVHLGMAFFSDMRRRFGDDLSIILSAYNAGPTRARRWKEFPEAGDLARFVERIPFTETRGYVKNVLRNREIYAWLYGEDRR